MTAKRRNALMMCLLAVLFGVRQYLRPTADIATWNQFVSVLIPVIAIAFALNETNPKWRWPIIAVDALVLITALAMIA